MDRLFCRNKLLIESSSSRGRRVSVSLGMTRVMQPESELWEVPFLEQEGPKIINTDNRSHPYRIDRFMSLGFVSLTTKGSGTLQAYFNKGKRKPLIIRGNQI